MAGYDEAKLHAFRPNHCGAARQNPLKKKIAELRRKFPSARQICLALDGLLERGAKEYKPLDSWQKKAEGKRSWAGSCVVRHQEHSSERFFERQFGGIVRQVWILSGCADYRTHTGAVHGAAEMLKPVSWDLQPFRWVTLDDHAGDFLAMNILPTYLAALCRFGYSDQEARFIYLVATHSGYFTRPQFLRFTRQTKGGSLHRFTTKLLALGHVRATEYGRQMLVFHLYSRLVYGPIDKDNLRNRRRLSNE